MTAAPSPPRFMIGQALSHGWRLFVENIGAMALYALIVFGVTIAVNLLLRGLGDIGQAIGGLVSFILNQVIAIGWLRIALDAVDSGRADINRVGDAITRVLVPFLIAALLFSLAVFGGLLLLIIPGLIIAVIFGFYGWVLVDGIESEPVASLRRSAAITSGERLHLFGFVLVLLLLNIVGLLLFVVGVIVTSAVSILALAHVYRRLEETAMGATA